MWNGRICCKSSSLNLTNVGREEAVDEGVCSRVEWSKGLDEGGDCRGGGDQVVHLHQQEHQQNHKQVLSHEDFNIDYLHQ